MGGNRTDSLAPVDANKLLPIWGLSNIWEKTQIALEIGYDLIITTYTNRQKPAGVATLYIIGTHVHMIRRHKRTKNCPRVGVVVSKWQVSLKQPKQAIFFFNERSGSP